MAEREEELAELRRELEQRHAELLRRVGAIEADLRQANRPRSSDWDDRSQEAENDEVLEALDDHGREEVDRIEAALRRFEAGVYGTCVECGVDIPIARLRAVPHAVKCIDCARADD